jgi:hypothetical protein
MQALPQPPQWLRSVRRSRHTPLHTVNPAPHDTTQRPSAHTCPAVQAVPQAPQWARSVWRSRQAPSHTVCDSMQVSTHAPASQMRPRGQTLLQPPQWARSVIGSTQTSSPMAPASPEALGARMQPCRLDAQVVAQRPLEHTCPAGHTLPQAPQCSRSVAVLTQTLLLQSVCVPGQLCMHAPLTHTCPAAQAIPHAPQCCALARVSTHCPPQAVCSAGQETSTAPVSLPASMPASTPTGGDDSVAQAAADNASHTSHAGPTCTLGDTRAILCLRSSMPTTVPSPRGCFKCVGCGVPIAGWVAR